jgi:sec-independent protein translocase protein TatB
LFDLSPLKILILGLLGLIIFGPDQLPKMAAQAGRALRDLRRLVDSARADLSENLGPEFRDFDLNDLNPRAFMRKHLLDDVDDAGSYGPAEEMTAAGSAYPGSNYVESVHAGQPDLAHPGGFLVAGEIPPYDAEST